MTNYAMNMKKLANAVILQALEDLQFPHRYTKNRNQAGRVLQDAKEFCLNVPAHPDLIYWADLADIPVMKIYQAASLINIGQLDVGKLKKELGTVAVSPTVIEDTDEDDLDD